MGSFNMQCAVSGETIYEGDAVVSLVLEPNAANGGVDHTVEPLRGMGQHFIAHTLPLHGTYQGYGFAQLDTPDAFPLAHALAQSQYQHGFSHTETQEMGWKGWGYALGGYDTDDDQNNITWQLHRSVYEALIATQEGLDPQAMLERLSNLEYPPFSDAVRTALAANIDAPEAQQSLKLFHALHELGHHFQFHTELAESNTVKTYRQRIKLAAQVKKALHTSVLGDAKYLCRVTGKAIADGERVRVLPIMSRIDKPGRNGRTDMGVLKRYQVTGLYGLSAPSFEATYDAASSALRPVQPLTASQRNLISRGVEGIDMDSPCQAVVDALTAAGGMAVDQQQVRRSAAYRDVCVVSAPVYDQLVAQIPRDTLVQDTAEWCRQAAVLTDPAIKDIHDQQALQALLETHGMYTEETDHLWPDPEDFEVLQQAAANPSNVCSKDLKMAQRYVNNSYREMLMDMRHPGSTFTRPNAFTQLMKLDQTPLEDSYASGMRFLVEEAVCDALESGKQEPLLQLLDRLKQITQAWSGDVKYVQALDSFNLGLLPSAVHPEGLDIARQHTLLHTVNEVAAQMIALRQRDLDDRLSR